MITIPIAVHCSPFDWQLDLFWYAHQRMNAQAHAVIIKRNHPYTVKVETCTWPIAIPHTMCEAFFDIAPIYFDDRALAINIQFGLKQVLNRFSDDQIIELIDCDMFHFRPCNLIPAHNEIIVCDVYENWHLFSQTKMRHVIDIYFEHAGQYYNGGFVPIIGSVQTFKRLLPEWIAIHLDILNRKYDRLTHWWAGMYALQAAAEKNCIQMRGLDCCYLPGHNEIQPSHYIGHYAVDEAFRKHEFPPDVTMFPNNPYYEMIKDWMRGLRPSLI